MSDSYFDVTITFSGTDGASRQTCSVRIVTGCLDLSPHGFAVAVTDARDAIARIPPLLAPREGLCVPGLTGKRIPEESSK